MRCVPKTRCVPNPDADPGRRSQCASRPLVGDALDADRDVRPGDDENQLWLIEPPLSPREREFMELNQAIERAYHARGAAQREQWQAECEAAMADREADE